jgi:hypothetical protein
MENKAKTNLKKTPIKAYSWTFKGEGGVEFLVEVRVTKIA